MACSKKKLVPDSVQKNFSKRITIPAFRTQKKRFALIKIFIEVRTVHYILLISDLWTGGAS